jgi:uncharacterized protein (DUF169 family)
MSKNSTDLSVLSKFDFEFPPVGVKFLYRLPEGVRRLDKKLAFCQMLEEAQRSQAPFYVDAENHACMPGLFVLGEDSLWEIAEAGYLGPAYGIYDEPRANRRVYSNGVPRLQKNTVKYVVFSPLQTLEFEPDLLVVMTDDVAQTEIVLRAFSYTNGNAWTSKMTGVLGCSWLYAYPYTTGEMNYLTTGLGYGMKVRGVFPGNRHLISIPFDVLPTVARNLETMSWVLPGYTDKRDEFYAQVYKELGISMPTL